MLNAATKSEERFRLEAGDLDDLAQGAAFLGAGGGGDPYVGRLLAKQAIEEFGMPAVIEPVDLDDDATVFVSAMMGAPTVMVEKGLSGDDIDLSLRRMSEILGRKPDAVTPLEIGGVNSMIPIVAAARNGLPLVNADGMGRAFPEMQMVTFNVYGVSASPAIVVDERLDTVVVETSDPKRAEDLLRAAAIQMGSSVINSCYPMTGKQLKETGIHGTLTLALGIGKAIRNGRHQGNPIDSLLTYLRATEFYNHCGVLFDGKIVDVRRETTRGFSVGHCKLKAIDNTEATMHVKFQNENLIASVNGKTVAMVPDLISIVDRETGQSITTEHLKYGQRVKVIGTSAAPIMRTDAALSVFGPAAFGFDQAFRPIQELNDFVSE